jgi:hypothetical protein
MIDGRRLSAKTIELRPHRAMHSFWTASPFLTALLATSIAACSSTNHSVGIHEDPFDGSSSKADGGGGDGDGGGSAVDAAQDGGAVLCNGPNPGGCTTENPCKADEECVANDGTACVSSGCTCDASSSSWTCLTDCNGKVCVKKAPTCGGIKNPAGCSTQNPCPTGKQCVPNDTGTCISSGCACDSSTNAWSCLPDCGGYICK